MVVLLSEEDPNKFKLLAYRLSGSSVKSFIVNPFYDRPGGNVRKSGINFAFFVAQRVLFTAGLRDLQGAFTEEQKGWA